MELEVSESFKEVEAACDKAIKQIVDMEYDSWVPEDGYTEVLDYGIAFFRKRCKIKLMCRQFCFAEQGFAATACDNGAQAVSLLGRGVFDCIVLDVMMPDMDGYDVCRAIREKHDTQIIFLSCLDQPDDKVRGLMSGGDAYMTKPYDLRELHAQVMACLRRGQKAALPPAGDFAIDRERRIVRLFEHCAILSKKEMALLSLFLEQQGKTLGKESLCTAI